MRKWGLRLLLGAVPLAWLAWRVSPTTLFAAFSEVAFSSLLVTFVLITASVFFAAVRWRMLLRAYGADVTPPILASFRQLLVSWYFNLLPGGVAGEAGRAVHARRYTGGRLTTSVVVLFVERLLGLAALASLTLLLQHQAAGEMGRRLGGGAALFLVAACLALTVLVAAIPPLRARLLRSAALPQRWQPMGVAFLLSFATQGLPVLAIAVIAHDVLPSVPLIVPLSLAPFIVLLTYVPITPGAIGQREAAFVLLFHRASLPEAAALTTSLCIFAVNLCVSLVGGLVHLSHSEQNDANPAPPVGETDGPDTAERF